MAHGRPSLRLLRRDLGRSFPCGGRGGRARCRAAVAVAVVVVDIPVTRRWELDSLRPRLRSSGPQAISGRGAAGRATERRGPKHGAVDVQVTEKLPRLSEQSDKQVVMAKVRTRPQQGLVNGELVQLRQERQAVEHGGGPAFMAAGVPPSACETLRVHVNPGSIHIFVPGKRHPPKRTPDTGPPPPEPDAVVIDIVACGVSCGRQIVAGGFPDHWTGWGDSIMSITASSPLSRCESECHRRGKPAAAKPRYEPHKSASGDFYADV
ncbi:hypothetical protein CAUPRSCDRAFT_11621 [Caulochytrium protostelioides]|uniref:Uncharacterized protein n=1 Tax=Caulochytrium protostelioides TaxID=1555241 RepID=A0A4P9WTU0_9FUNG|nr:hypothetical protein CAUPRSCDRAFT_11621 [Caulochytrium protostelioides]